MRSLAFIALWFGPMAILANYHHPLAAGIVFFVTTALMPLWYTLFNDPEADHPGDQDEPV
jgi:hypothetical protein